MKCYGRSNEADVIDGLGICERKRLRPTLCICARNEIILRSLRPDDTVTQQCLLDTHRKFAFHKMSFFIDVTNSER